MCRRPGGTLDLSLPLDELPSMIVDTETTGLDVNSDRIVSFGGVCAHGTRLFKSRMIDDLIDPGVPIPPVSTAIHGITDEMVAGARAFPEVYADFQRMAPEPRHRRAQCSLRPDHHSPGMRAPRPALGGPGLHRHHAARFAAEPHPGAIRSRNPGRYLPYRCPWAAHGPRATPWSPRSCFFRMMPRLQMQGFATLKDLLEFHCRQAVDIIAGQKQAGWITNQPALRVRDPDRPHQ